MIILLIYLDSYIQTALPGSYATFRPYRSVRTILHDEYPISEELSSRVPDTIIEKHDPLIPRELRDLAYGRRYFDVDGAIEWMAGVCQR